MPQIASYEDVKAGKTTREIPNGGGTAWRTGFITPPKGVVDHPVAFLAEGTPHRVIKPHFHEVDQFQVIVSGGGVIGKHPLSLNAVHLLRAHWDPGAQYIPAAKEKLVSVPNRKPWQVTEAPKFEGDAAVNVHTFNEIKDERGLAAYSLKLAAGVKTAGPDASNGNGQYIIVTKGSLNYQGKEYKAISIGFTKPDEGYFPIVAGPDGVEALVLNFPRLETAKTIVPEASKSREFRVWQCLLCSFSYDEAQGMPHDGIAPGTRWEDVPESWICPDCGTSKGDFEMAVVA